MTEALTNPYTGLVLFGIAMAINGVALAVIRVKYPVTVCVRPPIMQWSDTFFQDYLEEQEALKDQEHD